MEQVKNITAVDEINLANQWLNMPVKYLWKQNERECSTNRNSRASSNSKHPPPSKLLFKIKVPVVQDITKIPLRFLQVTEGRQVQHRGQNVYYVCICYRQKMYYMCICYGQNVHYICIYYGQNMYYMYVMDKMCIKYVYFMDKMCIMYVYVTDKMCIMYVYIMNKMYIMYVYVMDKMCIMYVINGEALKV